MPKELLLGHDEHGNELSVSHEERTMHMFSIGKSGQGKSKYLEHCIRQDILDPAEPGVMLIDPHGNLYDDIVKFCARENVKRNVHLVNPSDLLNVTAYNPLKSGTAEPDVLSRMMVEACAQVWGEDSRSTPMIRETLVALFYVLIENNLTLAESGYLMDLEDQYGMRKKIIDNLDDPTAREKWKTFDLMASDPKTKADFLNQMSPASRRLFEMNLSPRMRRVIGQSDRSLNISASMTRGDIILVNLGVKGNKIAKSDTQLLGALLLRDVYVSALARNTEYAKHKPFYVYVDECGQYLTSDVEDMLDETRKFGVHLHLACQRLGQLRRAGDSIFNGIMGGTEVKMIFGGMEHNDVIEMAKQVYMREIELNRTVDETTNPVVVGQELTTLKSKHDAEAFATSRASTSSFGSGSTTGFSTVSDITDIAIGEAIRETESDGFSEFSGGADTEAESHANVHGEGEHETYKNVYEDRPSAVWGLDKLIWEKASILQGLQRQHAVAYTHRRGTALLEIPFVKPIPNEHKSELPKLFAKRINNNSPIVITPDEADDAIQKRFEEFTETEPLEEDLSFMDGNLDN